MAAGFVVKVHSLLPFAKFNSSFECVGDDAFDKDAIQRCLESACARMHTTILVCSAAYMHN